MFGNSFENLTVLGIQLNSQECDGKCLAHDIIKIPEGTKLENWNNIYNITHVDSCG